MELECSEFYQEGKTALDYAVEKKRIAVVQFLKLELSVPIADDINETASNGLKSFAGKFEQEVFLFSSFEINVITDSCLPCFILCKFWINTQFTFQELLLWVESAFPIDDAPVIYQILNEKKIVCFADLEKLKDELGLLKVDMHIKQVLAKQLSQQEVIKDYLLQLEVGEKIGQGSEGEVFKGTYANQTVALKGADCTQAELERMWKEIQILRKLHHPQIVHFYGFQIATEKVYMVSEFMDQGDLEGFLYKYRQYYSLTPKLSTTDDKVQKKNEEKVNEARLLKISMELMLMAYSIIKGMTYMENYFLVHRDIAARNILLRKEKGNIVLKIADFGLSRLNNYRMTKDSKISRKWYAPEALERKLYNNKSDVWSFGVLFWELMNAGDQPPIHFRPPLDHYIENMQHGCVYPKSLGMVFDFIWVVNPDDRPSFKELKKFWQLILKNILHCNNCDADIPFPMWSQQ